MSKFTRIISLILAAVLVFAAVPGSAAVEYSGPCGENAYYEFDSETAVMTITGTGTITISSPFNGFVMRDTTFIDIGEGLTGIGLNCFRSFSNTEHVSLPSTLRSISSYAFSYTGLKDIEIPPNVKSLGDGCFEGCKKLESATLGAGINTLKEVLFQLCWRLREVTILGDISASTADYAIETGAFASCSVLEKITVRCPCPDVETISPHAFSSSTPDGIKVYYPSNCPEWAEVKPFDTENRHFVYIPDEPIPIVVGDANGDGVLSASDVSVVLSFVMNAGTMTKMAQLAADVDGDGKVTAADASLMAQLILG